MTIKRQNVPKPSFIHSSYLLKRALSLALSSCLLVFSGHAFAQIVINEIIQNPFVVTDDNGEWFELINTSASPIDIDGWIIKDNDTDSHVIDNGGPLNIEAGGYLVLARNADFSTNGGVSADYSYGSSFTLGNTGDELVLMNGDIEVDRVEWDGGPTFPDPTGASMSLLDPGLDNNVGSNWCTATSSFGDGDLGTPGAANVCVVAEVAPEVSSTSPLDNGSGIPLDSDIVINFSESVTVAEPWIVISCSSSGDHATTQTGGTQSYTLNPTVDFVMSESCTVDITAANIADTDDDDPPDAMLEDYSFSFITAGPPVESPILINELDADQTSTDSAEFIELFDGGAGSTALDGLVLVLFNGASDTAYEAFDLDGYNTNANGYFVVCGNPANVVNCDVDVGPSTNLIQNGADAAALYQADASSFPDGTPVTANALIDALVYDTDDADDLGLLQLLNPAQPQVNEGGEGNSSAHSNQRCPSGYGAARNTDTYVQAVPTPGVSNSCSAIEIFDIQGSGSVSPFDGFDILTANNIVTAVGPEGFFIQTPDDRADVSADTSNGIYVFTGGAPTVAVADNVDVLGRVTEFFDFTEYANSPTVTINSSGNVLPTIKTLNASVPSPDQTTPSCAIEFECYEGMLVQVSNGAVTAGNQGFGSDPIAEVFISASGNRTFREPGLVYPGVGGSIPTWDGNPEVFEMDPDKLGLANVMIPGGSSFSASGVIGFEYGDYELWPSSLSVTPAVLPRAVRSKNSGETTVGSFNLFRFATDGDYGTRLTKLSQYIRNVLNSPDILAVQEVDDIDALQDLADLISLDDSSVNYTPYLLEGNDVGGIDVGFMVRSDISVDSIAQLGKDEIFDYDGSLLHDRPPLLLEGRYTGNGKDFPLAVLVVHNRSLNGIETERVQLKRLTQAEAIAQMVQTFQVSNPATPLIVVGDYNAHEFTDGYVDTVGHIKGDFNPDESIQSGLDLVSPNLTNQVDLLPASERYSYVFEGNAQVLDHALTSQSAAPWVRGLQYGRGNADAAEALLNDPSTAVRSSDHDGLVLFVMTDFDGDGVADDADACPINDRLIEWDPELGCSNPIPTLGPAGLWLMLLMLGGLGVYTLRYPRAVKRQ